MKSFLAAFGTAILSTSLACAAPAPAGKEDIGIIIVISPKDVAPTVSEMKAKWNNPGADTLYRHVFSMSGDAASYTEAHDFMKCINHDVKLNTPTSCNKPQAFVGKDAPDVIAAKILSDAKNPITGGDKISINADINLLSVQEYSTPTRSRIFSCLLSPILVCPSFSLRNPVLLSRFPLTFKTNMMSLLGLHICISAS